MITWSDTVHATQNGNVQCMHHYWNPKMISLTDLNINLLRARVHHNQCSNGPRPVNRLGRLNGQLLACLLQWSFHLNNRTFFKLSLACFHFEGNRCCKTSLWVLYLYLWLKTDAFRLQSKYLIFSRYIRLISGGPSSLMQKSCSLDTPQSSNQSPFIRAPDWWV